MAQKFAQKQDKLIGPGPAGYKLPDPNIDHEENPKWTIQGKYLDKDRSNEVGPGQYEIAVKTSGGVTMKGKREYKCEKSDTPGPNQYLLGGTLTQNGITMGEKLEIDHNTGLPGPGNYNIPSTNVDHQENPHWSIKGKPKKVEDRMEVGPGQYDVIFEKQTKIGPTMGEKFEINHNTDPPGPGNYNIPSTNVDHQENPHWSIKGKHKKVEDQIEVGPGQYEVIFEKSTKTGPTMRGKNYYQKIDEIPGPKYFKDAKQQSTLSETKGAIITGKLEQKVKSNKNLGPGKYRIPDYDLNHEKNPQWSIYGKHKQEKVATTIGPGHYHDPDYNPQKDGISMKGHKKIAEVVDNKVPGPGYYNSKTTLNSNGVSILGKYPVNKDTEVTP